MKRYNRKTLLLEIVMIVLALIYMFPLYILVSLSLKSPAEVLDNPLGLPTSLDLSNYVTAWTESELGAALVFSVILTGVSVALTLLLAVFASYPLARSTTRMNTGTFALFMLGLILPVHLGMIPLYQTFRDLGLLGTPIPLLLVNVGTALPFAVFLFTTFIRALPRDYEEAAMIDGCGHFRAMWHVVLPLIKAVTGTVGLLTAINVWNEFLMPLLYLPGGDYQTVPLAINSFVGQFATQWNVVAAAIVIGITPILTIYILLQRRIIAGFAGGLKG